MQAGRSARRRTPDAGRTPSGSGRGRSGGGGAPPPPGGGSTAAGADSRRRGRRLPALGVVELDERLPVAVDAGHGRPDRRRRRTPRSSPPPAPRTSDRQRPPPSGASSSASTRPWVPAFSRTGAPDARRCRSARAGRRIAGTRADRRTGRADSPRRCDRAPSAARCRAPGPAPERSARAAVRSRRRPVGHSLFFSRRRIIVGADGKGNRDLMPAVPLDPRARADRGLDTNATDTTPRRRNIRIVVAYDGSEYLGWQVQPQGPTIQSVLQDALKVITGEAVPIKGSAAPVSRGSRPRSGGELPHLVDTEPTDFHQSFNSVLPPAIAVVAADEVDGSFDAQFSAVGKLYCYGFQHPRTLAVRAKLVLACHHEIESRINVRCSAYVVGE